MPTYFTPLRRKIGVLTLLMACVFAAGWVRSSSFKDRTVSVVGRHTISVMSVKQSIILLNEYEENPELTAWWFPGSRFQWLPGWMAEPVLTVDQLDGLTQHPEDDECITWRWHSFGFGIGTSKGKRGVPPNPFHDFTETYWVVPYWSIVIPLTLLSAWLLLSKPRAKPKLIAE